MGTRLLLVEVRNLHPLHLDPLTDAWKPTASGIGKACSLALAKEGAASVTVADINLDAAAQVAVGCDALATNPNFASKAIVIDVKKEDSVKRATAQVLQWFGRIDYGVNCAGVSGRTSGPHLPPSFPSTPNGGALVRTPCSPLPYFLFLPHCSVITVQ